jgi:hypothetical protein
MAKLGVYEVNINGLRHELQLTAEDAERIGATEVKAAKAPANKAGTAETNK